MQGSHRQQEITIADHGEIKIINYAELLDYHGGDSIWGLSVTFRALQLAAELFSAETPWDRRDIFIVSGHPGPGVRDAIEFVTKCISQNRFRLVPGANKEISCSNGIQYKWKISHVARSCLISLRDDFVFPEFYELLERLNTEKEQAEDKKEFREIKDSLAEKIWREPVTSNYLINYDNVNI